jgi:membrane protease YdiL (CAAX protease family)
LYAAGEVLLFRNDARSAVVAGLGGGLGAFAGMALGRMARRFRHAWAIIIASLLAGFLVGFHLFTVYGNDRAFSNGENAFLVFLLVVSRNSPGPSWLPRFPERRVD